MTGTRPAGAGAFRVSVIPRITATRMAVPTTWSMKPPGNVLRYGCGYVAKMPAVP